MTDDLILEMCDDFGSPPVEAESIRRLREYQDRAVIDTLQAFKDGIQRVLGTASTGTGKTVIMAHIAADFVERGKRVLLIAHEDTLLDQARDKFQRVIGLPVTKEKADERATLFDKIVVASVQTLRGERLTSWPRDHFGLILVDEAHRTLAKSYTDIINHFDTANVLGVTATATRGDKKTLSDVYSKLVFDYGLFKAVRDGWLVRPIVKTVGGITIDLGKLDVRAGDFVPEQLGHRIAPYLKEIAAKMREYVPNGTIMCFLPTVSTAKQMADELVAAGFRAASVDGEDSERDQKVLDFKAGKLDVLCLMGLFIEGFDYDRVDTIVCLRPTKLAGLYTQICGRASRPLNSVVPRLNECHTAARRHAILKASAKPSFTILDFLYLYDRHKNDLIKPQNLLAPVPEIADRMKREGDLFENEQEAERDLAASLEKALEDAAKKKRAPRTIDPFAVYLAAHDEDSIAYEPMGRWELDPVTDGQKNFLSKHRIDLSKVTNKGHAHRIIDWITNRQKQGLCAPRALMFLRNRGIDASEMSSKDARATIGLIMDGWKRKRSGQLEIQPWKLSR